MRSIERLGAVGFGIALTVSACGVEAPPEDPDFGTLNNRRAACQDAKGLLAIVTDPDTGLELQLEKMDPAALELASDGLRETQDQLPKNSSSLFERIVRDAELLADPNNEQADVAHTAMRLEVFVEQDCSPHFPEFQAIS